MAPPIAGCCSTRSRSDPRPVSRWRALRARTRNSSASSTARRSASRRIPASSSGRPMPIRSHPSACASRSPPTPSFRSGSSSEETEPKRSRRAWRSVTNRSANARGSRRTGARTAERAPSHAGADPATTRPSSIAVHASSRSAATWTHWSAVRTACPTRSPTSHIGYRRRSATADTSSGRVPSWRMSRSTSEPGESIPRPYPPSATSATSALGSAASNRSRRHASTSPERRLPDHRP